jgi:hypothetical protein
VRILRGSDAIVNIGGLYRYPYPVNLRNQEKNDIIRDLEAYHLFVVLEVSQKVSGNYQRRQTDRLALAQIMQGNEDTLFAKSKMGNPWHWD